MTSLHSLTSADLLALTTGERWFATRERPPEQARIVGVAHDDGELALPLVEIRTLEGTHDLYLLTLGLDRDEPYDALSEPRHVRRLAALCGLEAPCETVRPMGVEQSNSTVVVDGRHVLKVFRRLDAGPSPEVELLGALGAAGFPHAPALEGLLPYEGEPLETTLAVVTSFVAAVGGGWELALDSVAAEDSEWLPRRARRLGEVTGAMHNVFAETGDARLAPEEPSAEAMALLVATIEEDAERVATEVSDSPLASRVAEIRDLVVGLSPVGPPGLAIRVHGDYHLGQVLWSENSDWVVIDFEGEPARPLAERRQRTSGLRDVAGMMRSFAYVADGASRLRGVDVPEGWEAACRSAFLDGYTESVDDRLLPGGGAGVDRLLTLFELQKLLYELRYEAGHRPDWVDIPLAGLERMLAVA
jgi:maltokinase